MLIFRVGLSCWLVGIVHVHVCACRDMAMEDNSFYCPNNELNFAIGNRYQVNIGCKRGLNKNFTLIVRSKILPYIKCSQVFVCLSRSS